MRREGVEIAVEVANVDRQVRNGLGAIEEHGNAGRVRGFDDLPDRVDGSERVRDVGDGEESRPRGQEVREPIEEELAVVVEGKDP